MIPIFSSKNEALDIKTLHLMCDECLNRETLTNKSIRSQQ